MPFSRFWKTFPFNNHVGRAARAVPSWLGGGALPPPEYGRARRAPTFNAFRSLRWCWSAVGCWCCSASRFVTVPSGVTVALSTIF